MIKSVEKRNEKDYQRLDRVQVSAGRKKGKSIQYGSGEELNKKQVTMLSVLDKIKGFYGQRERIERRRRVWSNQSHPMKVTNVTDVSAQMVNYGKLIRDRKFSSHSEQSEGREQPFGSYTRIGVANGSGRKAMVDRFNRDGISFSANPKGKEQKRLGICRKVYDNSSENSNYKRRWLDKKQIKKENQREGRLTILAASYSTSENGQNKETVKGEKGFDQQLKKRYLVTRMKRLCRPMQNRGMMLVQHSGNTNLPK